MARSNRKSKDNRRHRKGKSSMQMGRTPSESKAHSLGTASAVVGNSVASTACTDIPSEVDSVPSRLIVPKSDDSLDSASVTETTRSVDDASPAASRNGSNHPGTCSDEMPLPTTSWSLSRLQVKRRYLVALLVIVLCWKGRLGVPEMDETFQESIIKRMKSFNETHATSLYLDQEKQRPGYKLAQKGAAAKFPVVMVPGFITSGLELWKSRECGKKLFRQRLWTAMTSARSFILDKECWRQHMMLDPITGGDPEGIALRAAEGFRAADYFLGTYWVWAKLIINLADLGYNPSNMKMEPYDWRLAYPMLEQRDGYFTRLKLTIETMHESNGEKVVLVTHSMGAQVMHFFFKWVTTEKSKGGGGGGKTWVNDYVHSYVNVAGSLLGVPKAAGALLSGEMSDTAIPGIMGDLAENFFGRRLRRDLWSTWGSLWAMLPVGGDKLWGTGADMCLTRRQNGDPFCPQDGGNSPLISISSSNKTFARNASSLDKVRRPAPRARTSLPNLRDNFAKHKTHSTNEVIDFLYQFGGGYGARSAASKDYDIRGKGKGTMKKWHDTTETPLPYAPGVKIFCMYGFGLNTERAYHYRRYDPVELQQDTDSPFPPVILDMDAENETLNTMGGSRFVDGDGSVPLLSLGYMCADGWRQKEYGLNPSNAKIYSREHRHSTEFRMDDPMRGGPGSAEHVDILGNDNVTLDILRIVSAFEVKKVEQDSIRSDILRIANDVHSSPFGGLGRRRPRWLKWLD